MSLYEKAFSIQVHTQSKCCKSKKTKEIKGDAKKSRRLSKNELRVAIFLTFFDQNDQINILARFYCFKRLSGPFRLTELILGSTISNNLTYSFSKCILQCHFYGNFDGF